MSRTSVGMTSLLKSVFMSSKNSWLPLEHCLIELVLCLCLSLSCKPLLAYTGYRKCGAVFFWQCTHVVCSYTVINRSVLSPHSSIAPWVVCDYPRIRWASIKERRLSLLSSAVKCWITALTRWSGVISYHRSVINSHHDIPLPSRPPSNISYSLEKFPIWHLDLKTAPHPYWHLHFHHLRIGPTALCHISYVTLFHRPATCLCCMMLYFLWKIAARGSSEFCWVKCYSSYKTSRRHEKWRHT